MISFFPSPYPDELWYSVICRYHVHSGNYCAKHTMRQLYGDYFSAPSLLLCGHIDTLLAQLPQGYLSARDIVMQHTFYPYYARFFPTQRKRSTYAYAINGNPLAVHRMGISQANGNHCSVMRYCPVCYQEDLQLYGEPYWHRSHQLPDIQIRSLSVFASISFSAIFLKVLRTVVTSQFSFLAMVLQAPINSFFVGCVFCRIYASTLLSAAENAESNSKNFLSAFQKCFAPYSALCCSCCSSNVSPVLEFSSTIVSIFCLFVFFIVLLL